MGVRGTEIESFFVKKNRRKKIVGSKQHKKFTDTL